MIRLWWFGLAINFEKKVTRNSSAPKHDFVNLSAESWNKVRLLIESTIHGRFSLIESLKDERRYPEACMA